MLTLKHIFSRILEMVTPEKKLSTAEWVQRMKELGIGCK